ncbi:hypothetical protein MATR_21110 [Marivirga tractuosa]|uniref:Uncharacterized protein n=1 Tax=Marivirga tractuosa (strain ATCC 23168 / DSM 4126 / NBRC 15989 / NCIMB 1408 / VKM B-1430 / H-43) TaxID=643867 RepID=E4TLY1_MARTH|nr:hypothetical protein Ftrac_0263 [Marivirga tractuosa DSM 4126]BDD15286.1 hypothetical protein MATR_21110 [Marivirga tractuosa]
MGYKRIQPLFIGLVFGFMFLVASLGNKVNKNPIKASLAII